MSLVIGIEYQNKVYMATDSIATTGGMLVRELPHGKFALSPCKKFVLGYVGYPRDFQVVERHWPQVEDVTDLPDALRETLSKFGRVKEYNDDDGAIVEAMNSTFMIGFEGKLYEISSDFALLKFNEPFSAIGNNKEMALGLLKATDYLAKKPIDRIEFVMNIMKQYCPGIGGEIYWDRFE